MVPYEIVLYGMTEKQKTVSLENIATKLLSGSENKWGDNFGHR